MIEGEGTSTPRASLSTRPSEAGTQLAEEGSSDGDRRSETTNNPTPSADANPGGGVRVDGPKGQGHPGQSQGRQRHHQERIRTANDHDATVINLHVGEESVRERSPFGASHRSIPRRSRAKCRTGTRPSTAY